MVIEHFALDKPFSTYYLPSCFDAKDLSAISTAGRLRLGWGGRVWKVKAPTLDNVGTFSQGRAATSKAMLFLLLPYGNKGTAALTEKAS